MTEHLPDERLTLGDLPPPGARVEALIDFAHTYHGYDVHGSFERVASIAHRVRDVEGIRIGRLGAHDALGDLRTALFFAERGAYHSGEVSHSDEAVMRALIELIRLCLFWRGHSPTDAYGKPSSLDMDEEELTNDEKLHRGLTEYPTPPNTWDSYIEGADLTSCDVPGPSASVEEVMAFAHTFDPYLYYGDTYETAQMIEELVNEDGLRQRLVDLRTALFWYARRCHDLGEVDPASELRLRELTELIRLRVLLREHGLDQEPDED